MIWSSDIDLRPQLFIRSFGLQAHTHIYLGSSFWTYFDRRNRISSSQNDRIFFYGHIQIWWGQYDLLFLSHRFQNTIHTLQINYLYPIRS